MSQRILVAACLIMAVASLTGVGLMWNLNSQNQRATLELVKQNHETTAKLVESINDSQQRLLVDLQSLVKRTPALENPIPANMVPLKIRFSLNEKGGPPAVGYTVSMTGGAAEKPVNRSNLKVRPDGFVDFGLVYSGQYQLQAYLDQNQEYNPIFSQYIDIPFLSSVQQVVGEIVCPTTNRADVSFSTKVVWPESLKDRKLWMVCTFSTPKWEFEGREWKTVKNHNYQKNPNQGGGGFFSIEDTLEPVYMPVQYQGYRPVWSVVFDESGKVRMQGILSGSLAWRKVNSLNSYLLWGYERPDLSTSADEFNSRLGPGRCLLDAFESMDVHEDLVTWPIDEVRLSSILVLSTPHDKYGTIQEVEGKFGGSPTIHVRFPDTCDILSEPFDVSKLAENDSLRTFVAKAGRDNQLEIHMPQKLETEVLHWMGVLDQLHKEVDEFRIKRETELKISRPDEEAGNTKRETKESK